MKKILSFSLSLLVLGLVVFSGASRASAAISVTSALLNGASTVNVAPGEVVTASVTVHGAGFPSAWGSVRHNVDGNSVCYNFSPNHPAGDSTESFLITAPVAAGTYDVSFNIYVGDLCALSAGSFTLTGGILVKETPELSVDNSPVTYNSFEQAAVVLSDTPGLVSDIKYNGSATVPTNVGTYAITADFLPTDTDNYISLDDASVGDFEIVKADADFSSIVSVSETYDGNPHGLAGSAVGVGDDGVLSGLSLGDSFETVPGGSAHWVFVDVTGNYNDASGDADVNILEKEITVNATGVNKIHDGNTDAVVILGSEDVLEGDDVSFSYAEPASFEDADIGADKPVHVTGITIGGGVDAGNYVLTSDTVDTTASITASPAEIDLGADIEINYGDEYSFEYVTTTNPGDLDYIILYNGSTTAPTNAGVYAVLGLIIDPKYSGQDSATLTINKINQLALNVIGLPESAVYQEEGISAGTEYGNGTGAITFSSGESDACSVDSVTGAVTITSGTGTCIITATKAGDNNYNPITSEGVEIIIGKADQTITFDPLDDKTMGDPDFTVNASSDSELPVTFTVGGESMCSISESEGTYTVHLTGIGMCTIIAHQGGDDNYNPAEDVSQSFEIAQLTHTINASAGEHGAVSPTGEVIVADGSNQIFNFTPDNHFHVADVVVDEVSVGAVESYTFTEVTANRSISVSFERDPSSGSSGGSRPKTNGEVLGVEDSSGEVLGASKFIFTLFLKKGPPYHLDIWGAEVTELQKLLAGLGFYKGPIDGKFGILTEEAVKAYQQANPPLKVDGIVGPETRAVLNK